MPSTHERRTYLVTGAAGFIGSHLCTALVTQGHHVLGIDNLSTGRLENIHHLLNHPLFHFARASITDEIVLDRLASQSDIIVHLAAAVGVKLIVENPVHTIETNIMGTDAVLKAALRYNARVLVASTSEVYGKATGIPFREDDDVLLGPTSRHRWAYAASKMVDEFLALAYGRQNNVPVVIFRLFNTVGPKQTGQYGMVIPRFVQQAIHGESITVYGDGNQSRCFLHVDDAVRAIIGLCESDVVVGQVFNVGNDEEVTITQLAYKVLELVDQLVPSATPRPDPETRIRFIPYEEAYVAGFEDMQRRVPDTTKIATAIGWSPRHSLEQILHDVIRSIADS